MRKRKAAQRKILTIAGVFTAIAMLSATIYLVSKPQYSEVQPETSSPTPSEEQVVQLEEPKYSVNITSVSDVITRPHSVTYQATLTNISAEPYITNFAFYKCQLEDESGNGYEGRLMTETTFDQAILPGKSQTITVSDGISISGYTNSGSGFEKCDHDSDGVKQCRTLSTLQVKSCTAYITTDGSQASNEWGDYPLAITFPGSTK